MSLEIKIDALKQLILQRFQSLIAISSIAFVVAGVVLSTGNDLIHNQALALTSTVLFVFIALTGMARFLYIVRSDIKAISNEIEEFASIDWSKPPEEKKFKADYWPETLFCLLVLGVILFGISLACW